MQREPRRPAVPTSHLTPRGHQKLKWGSHFLHRSPRRDSQFLKAITSALPVSGLPTPPRHRTDTEKSEADQAEGGGFGDGGNINVNLIDKELPTEANVIDAAAVPGILVLSSGDRH